ncbi:MAG TPA: hypothetical protein VGR78_17015, partial [Verrucomicrobiae bacterium]|nr:hypothetical protein [Verrucomicrobiae bacterium]
MKKICLSFLFLLAAGVIVTISSGDAAETNAEPQPVQAAAAPPVANFPEIGVLRQQLSAIEKSNEEATKKWEALMQQNSALSNVLTG